MILFASQLWQVTQSHVGNDLRIFYGEGDERLQCAALHPNDGYFRLAPATAWGTSVVLPPTLWSRGRLRQKTALQTTWRVENDQLVCDATGQIDALKICLSLILAPPHNRKIVVDVRARTSGDIEIDARRGEAFKPAMLSSMRVFRNQWDANTLLIDRQTRNFDDAARGSAWLVAPDETIVARRFGFGGGHSAWKRDAPSVEIALEEAMPIAGWHARSHNPNGDNLALWAASESVLRAWNYTITVWGAD